MNHVVKAGAGGGTGRCGTGTTSARPWEARSHALLLTRTSPPAPAGAAWEACSLKGQQISWEGWRSPVAVHRPASASVGSSPAWRIVGGPARSTVLSVATSW